MRRYNGQLLRRTGAIVGSFDVRVPVMRRSAINQADIKRDRSQASRNALGKQVYDTGSTAWKFNQCETNPDSGVRRVDHAVPSSGGGGLRVPKPNDHELRRCRAWWPVRTGRLCAAGHDATNALRRGHADKQRGVARRGAKRPRRNHHSTVCWNFLVQRFPCRSHSPSPRPFTAGVRIDRGQQLLLSNLKRGRAAAYHGAGAVAHRANARDQTRNRKASSSIQKPEAA